MSLQNWTIANRPRCSCQTSALDCCRSPRRGDPSSCLDSAQLVGRGLAPPRYYSS